MNARPISRSTYAAAVGAALALGLAACGGSDDHSNPPASPSSSAPTTDSGAPGTGGAVTGGADGSGTGDASAATGTQSLGAVPSIPSPGGAAAMPPGPHKPLPTAVPDVAGWRKDGGAGLNATYVPPGATKLSESAIVTIIPRSQPVAMMGGGKVQGHVYCEPSGGVAAGISCKIPYQNGFIDIIGGKNLTMEKAFELGNKIYDAPAD